MKLFEHKREVKEEINIEIEVLKRLQIVFTIMKHSK
jgi:hypothetical protein